MITRAAFAREKRQKRNSVSVRHAFFDLRFGFVVVLFQTKILFQPVIKSAAVGQCAADDNFFAVNAVTPQTNGISSGTSPSNATRIAPEVPIISAAFSFFRQFAPMLFAAPSPIAKNHLHFQLSQRLAIHHLKRNSVNLSRQFRQIFARNFQILKQFIVPDVFANVENSRSRSHRNARRRRPENFQRDVIAERQPFDSFRKNFLLFRAIPQKFRRPITRMKNARPSIVDFLLVEIVAQFLHKSADEFPPKYRRALSVRRFRQFRSANARNTKPRRI